MTVYYQVLNYNPRVKEFYPVFTGDKAAAVKLFAFRDCSDEWNWKQLKTLSHDEYMAQLTGKPKLNAVRKRNI